MEIPVLVCPSVKVIVSRRVAEYRVMPPEINPDPNRANLEWLLTHDPRICVYMRGVDEQGEEMVAYLADMKACRNHVWQDLCEGANHSRYPWPKLDYNNYWVSDLHLDEAALNLLHETLEDRKMADRHVEKIYDDAHSYYANPKEWEARHGKFDIVEMLEGLGWVVEFPDVIREQIKDNW